MKPWPPSRPPPPISRAGRTTGELWSDLASDAWRRGNAAADPAEALRWLDRARRIVPDNDMVGLSLALAHLRAGDPEAAAPLFAAIAARWDLLEAWTGLAAGNLRLGQAAPAASAMAAALSRHAVPSHWHGLAAAAAKAAGYAGWCAVDPAGWLHADTPAELALDGRTVAPRWRVGRCQVPAGARLEVSRGGAALLGSPIDLAALGACEGIVSLDGRGELAGWAWHPRNPAKAPLVTVAGRPMTLRSAAEVALECPLARPRRLRIPSAGLPAGVIEVLGPDGRNLLGSPVHPLRLEAAESPQPISPSERGGGRIHAVMAGLDPAIHTKPAVAPRPGLKNPFPTGDLSYPARAVDARIKSGHDDSGTAAPPDVVVPVYRGLATTLACLQAVLASLPEGSRLHVVNDGSPDAELVAAVNGLAADRRLNLITLPRNLGFPGAANAGLRVAAGRDVALVNSDALVPPDWLRALGEALHSAPDIASACPLSNEATILSYPNKAGGNPPADPAALTALARRANGAAVVDIPVAVGFCMLIRRDCLDQVGLLREDVFAQGYGEENDWCLRARQLGWRHVAVPGCYVAHEGAASFGSARRHLLARNGALLEQLHPGYHRSVQAWIARDPLAPARRKIDALRWAGGRKPAAVAFVTHGGGGGVERVVAERAASCRAAGLRPVVIRPLQGEAVIGDAVMGDGDTPNLRFRLPAEWPAMLRLLRADGVVRVELHHTLGHAPAILELAARLAVPQEVFVHDYAWFCPRIALVAEQAYCGEPDVAACERCVAAHGSHLSEPVGPAALVARSAAVLAGAARVVAPSADVARRMRRHFPRCNPEILPWEDDAAIAPPPATGRVRHVAVAGGIGLEKGFEVLLGCVADARMRRLALRFTVVGSTADDERLLAAGPAFITGRYGDDEVVALIRAQGADFGLLPSVWPETWCFTLGHLWRAGLRVAVFDLGTPAERVRRTGWGHVLPLGLPPPALNDWLLQRGRSGAPQTGVCQTPSPLRLNPAI